MDIKILANSLIFDGILDERISEEGLFSALRSLKEHSNADLVELDFSKVIRANSSGIVKWLKFVRDSKTTFCYVNCPIWLVGQFNYLNGFLEHQSYATSLQVPFYSQETDSSKIITLQIGRDIKVCEDYSDYQLPTKEIGGKLYEPDIDPGQYFSFISTNFKTFQEKLR